MKLHRFFISPNIELKQDFWLQEASVLNQWNKVLRFRVGQEVVLFDGIKHDRLYKIIELSEAEAHLELVTEFKRKMPSRDIYLFWALLKKDKNDWILQKCTELGVSHFIPILSDRTEKTGFDVERAKKIATEASEQCGRSDIPNIREPITVQTAIDEFSGKVEIYICEQDGVEALEETKKSLAVLIGPEGGWSEAEKKLFKTQGLPHLNLHDFTLRAETAAVAATVKLIQ